VCHCTINRSISASSPSLISSVTGKTFISVPLQGANVFLVASGQRVRWPACPVATGISGAVRPMSSDTARPIWPRMAPWRNPPISVMMLSSPSAAMRKRPNRSKGSSGWRLSFAPIQIVDAATRTISRGDPQYCLLGSSYTDHVGSKRRHLYQETWRPAELLSSAFMLWFPLAWVSLSQAQALRRR
jgi:hypothetical protein